MNATKIFLLFIFSSFFCFPARAEEVLSLDQALRIAYANNPHMTEARHEITAAKGRWIEAEALPDPEFEMEIGGFKSGEGHDVGSVAVHQPLAPLGTRFLSGRIASDGVKISESQLLSVWNEIAVRVRGLYAAILAFEKATEVSGDNLQATRQFLTQVQSRFQSGSALKSDFLRARIENARAETDLLTAQKNLKVARAKMNVLLGRPAEIEFELVDALDYRPLHYKYAELKERAHLERADVQSEQIKLSLQKKSVWRELLRTIFPAMSLGLERTTEEFENDTSLLIKASYPLWGFNLGKVKQVKAEREKQEVRLEALLRQVSLDLYEAFLEAELADKKVQIQKKSLEESYELLRQITVQYSEGEIEFLTYLENIKTIKETRLDYFNTLKDFQEKLARLETAFANAPMPEGDKYEK